MTRRAKAAAGFLAVLILVCAAAAVHMVRAGNRFYKKFYPMGGIVTVVDKDDTDPERCTITIEQGGVGGRYTLECTREQYDAVQAGAEVNCERWQSEVDHSGVVHNIKGPY